MLISEEYRELNREMLTVNKTFGSTSWSYAPRIMNLCKNMKTSDVLDYGCGQRRLACNLPFKINEYDPAIRGYDDPPKPADIVVCTDVLEHCEPSCLEEVIMHLKALTKRALFLSISTVPSKRALPNGKNPHLIVRPCEEWLLYLMRYFDIWQLEKADGLFLSVFSHQRMKEL